LFSARDKYQVVAKGIPRKFGDNTMILVQIISVVGKNEIRRELRSYLPEEVLDFPAHIGEIAVSEVFDDNMS
jgi:hypothetical protein